MNENDNHLTCAPPGWRYSLVLIALVKRWIQIEAMPPAERLTLLEALTALAGQGVSAEAIARVDPACPVAARMCREAGYNLDAFGNIQVFDEFARLNPSLLAALQLCRGVPTTGHAA